MERLSDTSNLAMEAAQDESGCPVLVLGGEVDCSNSDELRRSIEQIVAVKPERLTFDLTSLTFMDSSGVSIMVFATNEVPDVVVRNASPIVRRVLDATGLSAVLHLS